MSAEPYCGYAHADRCSIRKAYYLYPRGAFQPNCPSMSAFDTIPSITGSIISSSAPLFPARQTRREGGGGAGERE